MSATDLAHDDDNDEEEYNGTDLYLSINDHMTLTRKRQKCHILT